MRGNPEEHTVKSMVNRNPFLLFLSFLVFAGTADGSLTASSLVTACGPGQTAFSSTVPAVAGAGCTWNPYGLPSIGSITGTASAFADYGILKVGAEIVSVMASSSYDSSNARSSASFDDQISVLGNGTGFVTFSAYASGTILGSGNLFLFQLDAFNSPAECVIVLANSSCTVPMVPIVFGKSYRIFAQAKAAVGSGAVNLGTTDERVDFTHTAQVSGIQVYDSQGIPIAAPTIASSSGFEYPVDSTPTPTPEPSTFTMMSAGLGIFLASRFAGRRRR